MDASSYFDQEVDQKAASERCGFLFLISETFPNCLRESDDDEDTYEGKSKAIGYCCCGETLACREP